MQLTSLSFSPSLTVKYCGLNLSVNELLESTGSQVTVQFMSGTHHRGRGFYLSYSTTEHTGEFSALSVHLLMTRWPAGTVM